MAKKKGRGWHGDSKGHSKAAKKGSAGGKKKAVKKPKKIAGKKGNTKQLKRDLMAMDKAMRGVKMGSTRHKRLSSLAKKGYAKKTKVFGEKYSKFKLTDKGFRKLNKVW